MKNFYCSLFGHDYQVTKNVTYHVKEYKCTRCKQCATTNSQGGLTPLTPKHQEINRVLERIHACKSKRRELILDR